MTTDEANASGKTARADKTKEGASGVIWVFIRMAVLVYLGFGAVLYFAQSFLLYPGGSFLHSTPEDRGFEYEEVHVEPEEGEETHGWYVYTDRSPRGVFLFSTGNAGTISERLVSIGQFRDLGFDVLIYDYGGYGESSGRPSEQRLYNDVRAMWRHLAEDRGVPAKRIVLFGRSLGSGPTIQLATEVTPGAVIVESAFRSVPAMARRMFPVYPVNLMVRDRYDNEAKITEIDVPKLFVHSPQDEVIPFDHGRALYEMAPEPKQFLEIAGGHNDGFVAARTTYMEGFRQFLFPLFSELDERW